MATNMSSSLNCITSIIENQAAMKTPSKWCHQGRRELPGSIVSEKLNKLGRSRRYSRLITTSRHEQREMVSKMFKDRKQKGMKKALAVESSDEESQLIQSRNTTSTIVNVRTLYYLIFHVHMAFYCCISFQFVEVLRIPSLLG